MIALLNVFFSGLSLHQAGHLFASASDNVTVWDMHKTSPVSRMSFTSSNSSKKDSNAGDHLTSVCFNQSEINILASSGSDRTICLYDLRSGVATERIQMQVSLT